SPRGAASPGAASCQAPSSLYWSGTASTGFSYAGANEHPARQVVRAAAARARRRMLSHDGDGSGVREVTRRRTHLVTLSEPVRRTVDDPVGGVDAGDHLHARAEVAAQL